MATISCPNFWPLYFYVVEYLLKIDALVVVNFYLKVMKAEKKWLPVSRSSEQFFLLVICSLHFNENFFYDYVDSLIQINCLLLLL